MLNRKLIAAGAALTTAMFFGACADGAPTEPGTGPESQDLFRSSAVPASGFQGTLDAEFVRIASSLVGFGGLYFDEAGVLTVVMKGDASTMSSSAVAGAVREGLTALQLDAAALQNLRVVAGQYDFAELDAMHRAVAPVLSIQGVVFTDADEVANRIRIGVENQAAAAAVERALAMSGISRDAVIISETEPIELNQSLQSRVRPVAGGLQINFTRGTSGFVCTHGFNVRAPSRPNVEGFVTNSHCSDTRGTVIPTPYWQHSRNVADTYIGEEAHDIPFFQGGVCPEGRNCRYSDALGVRYEEGVEQAFGAIYRTQAPGSPGTLQIDQDNPRWEIVDEIPFPIVGQFLHKTGRTSGWTNGNVTATCQNSNVAGEGFMTMLCQDRIATTSAGGDSGSPYFERIGETNQVRLIGIHWGSGGGTTVMSAMANIRYENEGPVGWITYPGQTPPPSAPR
jgi:hypothetical protein